MFFMKKDKKLNNKKYYKNKYPMAAVVFAVLGGLFLTVGTSLSFLTETSYANEINTIRAGTLLLEFAGSDAINMTNAVPQEDEEALENNAEYTFTINNTGDIPVNYELYFNDVCSTTNTYNSITPDVCIPLEYIHIGVKIDNGEYEVKSLIENKIVLDSGFLAVSGSKSYSIKIWLNLDTPNDYQSEDAQGNPRNVIFAGKVNIFGEQTTGPIETPLFEYEIIDNEVTITNYLGTDPEIILPDTLADKPVTKISANAFENKELTSVILNNNLKEIGSNAFKNNNLSGLITIPATVTIIGTSAFENNSLTSITFSSGLTTIGSSAFKGNALTGTITLPSTISSIGAQAFLKSTTSNSGMTKLINNSSSAFNWYSIIANTSKIASVTGLVEISGVSTTFITKSNGSFENYIYNTGVKNYTMGIYRGTQQQGTFSTFTEGATYLSWEAGNQYSVVGASYYSTVLIDFDNINSVSLDYSNLSMTYKGNAGLITGHIKIWISNSTAMDTMEGKPTGTNCASVSYQVNNTAVAPNYNLVMKNTAGQITLDTSACTGKKYVFVNIVGYYHNAYSGRINWIKSTGTK